MQRPRPTLTLLVSVAAALALAGCASDPEPNGSQPTAAATDGTTDTGAAAEDAQDTLDEAGIDFNAPGTAEVQFMGETYTLDSAEQFGCFIAPDAGSDGTVNFDGSDEAGNEIYVEWSGDSTATGRVDFTTADGTSYRTTYDSELEVTIDGSSAELGSTMKPDASPDAVGQLTASLACG